MSVPVCDPPFTLKWQPVMLKQWLISQSGSLSDYIEQRFSDDLQRTYTINKICTLVVLNHWEFFAWLLLQDNLACPVWYETNLKNLINILTWLKIFFFKKREKLLESQDVSVICVDYVLRNVLTLVVKK